MILAHGDLLMIDSDGLSEARPGLFRDHHTVAAQISASDTAQTIAQTLVDLATAGGPLSDDLTVVVVRRSPAETAVS